MLYICKCNHTSDNVSAKARARVGLNLCLCHRFYVCSYNNSCAVASIYLVMNTLQNCADGNDKPVLMILGNKCDLDDERRIHTETASQAAQEFDTIFAEVSARTGRGIDEVRGLNCSICYILYTPLRYVLHVYIYTFFTAGICHTIAYQNVCILKNTFIIWHALYIFCCRRIILQQFDLHYDIHYTIFSLQAFDELVDRMVRLHEQRDSFNFTDSSIMLRDHTISAEPHGCKC